MTLTHNPARADEQSLDNVIPYSDPVFNAADRFWNPESLQRDVRKYGDGPWIVSGDQIAHYKAGVRGIRANESHAVSSPEHAPGGWSAHCLDCQWLPEVGSRDAVKEQSMKHRLEVTR